MPVLPDTAPSRRRATFLTAALMVAGVGCGNSVNALSSAGAAGTSGGGTGGYTGPNLGQGGDGKIPVGTAQCSDGIDNDHDGRTDYDDPECVGPLDNDEGSFATGIPGDNVDPCKQDCFFDGNSGMGDDHCDWQLRCDPKSTEAKCPYDAAYVAQHETECSTSASQTDSCVKGCQPLVPNGCDCFGCCAIPGGPTIRLAGSCTAADFNNPAKCPPCTQVTQCANPCDTCEICIGKPTLPPQCTPDAGTPPPPSCGDYTPCGPGTNTPANSCPSNTGCVTGCCRPTIIIG